MLHLVRISFCYHDSANFATQFGLHSFFQSCCSFSFLSLAFLFCYMWRFRLVPILFSCKVLKVIWDRGMDLEKVQAIGWREMRSKYNFAWLRVFGKIYSLHAASLYAGFRCAHDLPAPCFPIHPSSIRPPVKCIMQIVPLSSTYWTFSAISTYLYSGQKSGRHSY